MTDRVPTADGPGADRAELLDQAALLIHVLESHGIEPPAPMKLVRLFPTDELERLIATMREQLVTRAEKLRGWE